MTLRTDKSTDIAHQLLSNRTGLSYMLTKLNQNQLLDTLKSSACGLTDHSILSTRCLNIDTLTLSPTWLFQKLLMEETLKSGSSTGNLEPSRLNQTRRNLLMLEQHGSIPMQPAVLIIKYGDTKVIGFKVTMINSS